MERLASEPASAETLNGWKSFLEGSVLLPGLTSLQEMNRQLLELPRNNLSSAYYGLAQQRLREITAAELQSAARQMLQRDALVWVVAGPSAAVEKELLEAGLNGVLVQ